MLEINVLTLLIMVTCKETCGVIFALHKKGFTGKDISGTRLHLNQPIVRSSRTSRSGVL